VFTLQKLKKQFVKGYQTITQRQLIQHDPTIDKAIDNLDVAIQEVESC